MTIITTAEELLALHRAISAAAEPALVRATTALWGIREGEDGELSAGSAYSDGEGLIPASMVQLPWTVLYRPDQPVSAAPTEEQIAEAFLSARSEVFALRGVSHPPNDSADDMPSALIYAEAVAALYPTCQPSEGAVREAAVEYARENASDLTDEGVGALARGFHDGALALLPGRPEAEVKAEALEEAADDWYSDDPQHTGHWGWHQEIDQDGPVLCRSSEDGRRWLHARAAALRGER